MLIEYRVLNVMVGGSEIIGGIVFGSECSPLQVVLTFDVVQDFTWNVNEDIDVDIDFSWNLGETAQKWFRVEATSCVPTCPIPTAPTEGLFTQSSIFPLGSFWENPANGPWIIDVNWGDGSPHTTFFIAPGDVGPCIVAAPGCTIPSKPHNYVDKSISYVITVTVTSTVGFVGQDSFSVVPFNSNVPPYEGLFTSSSLFPLGSFWQNPAYGPWSIDVDWGDGSPHTVFPVISVGICINGPPGCFIPSKPHNYVDKSQTYTITRIVNSAIGEVGRNSFRVVPFVVPPTQQNCQLVTVMANSPKQLCEQLSATNFQGQITKVQVFTQPAFPEDVTNQNCNIPIDVPQSVIQSIPECLEFALTASGNIEMVMFGLFAEVFVYEPTGGIFLSGTSSTGFSYTGSGGITFGGSAIAPYGMTGGIALGGGADVESSSFTHVPTGGITFDGEADVESSALGYAAEGGIVFSGSADAEIIIGMTYVASGGICLHGSAIVVGSGFAFDYSASGGIEFGGEAEALSSNYEYVGDGGLVFGGEAEAATDNWTYIGSGGITFSGVVIPVVVGDGGLSFGGSAEFVVGYIHVPDGGIVFDGEAAIVSSAFSYSPLGGIIFSGEADAHDNFYDLSDEWVMDDSVPFSEAEFSQEQGDTLSITTDMVNTRCGGCHPLPVRLQLTHNLGSANLLADFLFRNNYVMVGQNTMTYSRINDAWQTNLFIKGQAANGGNEQWNVLYEWACVSQIGPYELGDYAWKFGLSVVRKTDVQQLSSKITLAFASRGVCDDPLRFFLSFITDTKNQLIKVRNPVVVDLKLFKDDIGLFKGSWEKSPNLKITIADEFVDNNGPVYDIKPIFPERVITNTGVLN